MALSTRLAVTARNAALDVVTALLNTGYIRLYTGSQDATPETTITGTLLAEPRFGATAFAAASGGAATANAITEDSAADATGTAGKARLLKSDGTTAVMDLTAGVGSGFNVNLATDSIVQNAAVQITSMTLTWPMQGA